MRIIIGFILLLLVAASCRPAKKVQRIEDAITKVDTSKVVIVIKNDTIDSSKLIREVYNKVLKNKIDFNTFSAKVKVVYEGKELSDEANAFIRIHKDSIIWISLRGALGIEGFRVLITKDSVQVLNLLKKQVTKRTIGFLQEVTELPFDFYTLQDLIIGNPIFIDNNIVSYRTNGDNELLVLMNGKLFKHLVTLDNTDFKILHSKLDDVDVIRNRTSDITFSDYDLSAGVPFATKRKITVSEKSKLDIQLEFKQYNFNQSTTFPFNIPKNYKRL